MNDPGFLIITAWKTINSKRQIQAERLAKDYGLSKLQKTLYIGRLSLKERGEFEQKMVSLLSGARDRLHLFTTCRSCAIKSNVNDVIREHYDTTAFEIV
jgi:CRISPR/Cas system-associated endoribonuclease Cas2